MILSPLLQLLTPNTHTHTRTAHAQHTHAITYMHTHAIPYTQAPPITYTHIHACAIAVCCFGPKFTLIEFLDKHHAAGLRSGGLSAWSS